MSETALKLLPGAPERLWTVHDAAAYLGMSEGWTYRAAEKGKLPHRMIGSRLRFLPSELRAWADGQTGSRSE